MQGSLLKLVEKIKGLNDLVLLHCKLFLLHGRIFINYVSIIHDSYCLEFFNYAIHNTSDESILGLRLK